MTLGTTAANCTFRAWPGILSLLVASLGCGDRPPARAPDAPPEGTASEHLGAPHDTRYAAEIEATRGRVRVIVREQSVCDVIPVQSVGVLEEIHRGRPGEDAALQRAHGAQRDPIARGRR